MPQMANITVKNVANADVIYVAAAPSSGDKNPAVWRQNALTNILGQRPKLTVLTRDSGGSLPGRHMSVRFTFPIIETIEGRATLVSTFQGSVEVVIPTNTASDASTEAFTQFGNLLVSTLIRAVVTDGYAPT